jgi:hypothetical protein
MPRCRGWAEPTFPSATSVCTVTAESVCSAEATAPKTIRIILRNLRRMANPQVGTGFTANIILRKQRPFPPQPISHQTLRRMMRKMQRGKTARQGPLRRMCRMKPAVGQLTDTKRR